MEYPICKKTKPGSFNKPAYAIFIGAGICAFMLKNFSEAFTFLGLAMIFDPFNTIVPFGERPLYQRAWLFIHLVITIALLLLMWIWK